MKRMIGMTFLLVGFLTPSISMADYGCERKLAALEKQLSYAKQYGNAHRVAGLERAIMNVKTYCGGGYKVDSPEAKDHYKAELRLEKSEEIMEKIADAHKDLAKAEYKYEKAKYKGDFEDQLEAEYKMKEARMRIDMYEKYMETLK